MRAPTEVTCPACGKVTRSPRWSNLTLTAYCAHCHKKIALREPTGDETGHLRASEA